MKLTVTKLERTSLGSPSQWEGVLGDNRVIYIRYKRGVLKVGIGDNLDAAIDDNSRIFELPDEYFTRFGHIDGGLYEGYSYLALGDLIEITEHFLDWNNCIFSGYDDSESPYPIGNEED